MSRDGKLYLNGTVVDWETSNSPNIALEGKRNHSDKTFQIRFKQRMAIYDAITIQHYVANQSNRLHHTFLTLTFRRNKVPGKPNKVVTRFFETLKRSGFLNYCWTREIGPNGGLVHYHYTTVGPSVPIADLNNLWCICRNDYASNAVRSSVNPLTGKSQMVIHSLYNARAYVAKYMTKEFAPKSGSVGELNGGVVKPGRVWACSHDLKCEPVRLGNAVQLAKHEYYGTGQVRDFEFARIGKIKPYHSYHMCMEAKEQRKKEKSSPKIKKLTPKVNSTVEIPFDMPCF